MSEEKKKKEKYSTRKLALLGVLVALGMIFGYLESLLPTFFGVPGIKAGFANICVITAMYILGLKEAIVLAVVRIVLSGITFSGLFTMLYSLAGAALSIAVMGLLKKTGRFSVTAMSIAGGVMHNVGQLIVACLVTGSTILYYLPVLIVAGAAAGLVTGVISGLTVSRIKTVS